MGGTTRHSHTTMENMPMYKALLKWSLTQTDGTTGPSTAMPMTDEKRKFLAAAMESYVLDETKRMHDILIILKHKRSEPSTVPCRHDTASSVAVEATPTTGSTQIGVNADTKPPNPPPSAP